MKEKIPSIGFIVKAFSFEFRQIDKREYENARSPMTAVDKIKHVISTVQSKDNLTELIRDFSSYNYGINLLNSVFPKNVNPDEYHSRNGNVSLDEHPIQVMGWKEYDELVFQGIQSGLNKVYITRGFEDQAEKRGIDTEFHFWETVSLHNDSQKLFEYNNP